MTDKEAKRLQEAIDRLTEEVKELKIQLAEKQDKFPQITIPSNIVPVTDIDNIPPACKHCPNHPSNGGSGICHCILGLQQVTC